MISTSSSDRGYNDSTGDCTPDSSDSAEDAQGEFIFGNPDGDLGVVLLDSCNSVRKCVWNNVGYAEVDGSTVFKELAGFHGLSYATSAQVDALESYVDASLTSGVGENWLDYRYFQKTNDAANPTCPSETVDQCPVVFVRGNNVALTDSFFLNGGLDDRFSTGTPHQYGSVYYLDDCDACGGGGPL